MRPRIAPLALLVLAAILCGRAAEAANLLLRPAASASAGDICARYGFTVVSSVAGHNLYLVKAPDSTTQSILDGILANDATVANLEFSKIHHAPTLPGGPELTQSVAGILESYETTFLNYYGGSAWDSYIAQQAAQTVSLTNAHTIASGAGVIAIIDTGIDETHPALQNVLVPGYDFVHELQGFGSEWNDVPGLQQSVAGILETYGQAVSNGSTSAGLPLPAYFGHGTMVAGIVHLAAPTSRIMPLKAFTADGTTTTYDILRAVYYATDNGARIINMSFAASQSSREIYQALAFAASKNVILLAAVGNDALLTDTYPVYPAAYSSTVGTGSTSPVDHRSTFSNYGIDVTIGAPGEGLLTTYPGNLYAAVWGTSFSVGWTTGAAGLFLQRDSVLMPVDVNTALSKGAKKLKSSEGMGYGRVDLYNSLLAVPIK